MDLRHDIVHPQGILMHPYAGSRKRRLTEAPVGAYVSGRARLGSLKSLPKVHHMNIWQERATRLADPRFSQSKSW